MWKDAQTFQANLWRKGLVCLGDQLDDNFEFVLLLDLECGPDMSASRSGSALVPQWCPTCQLHDCVLRHLPDQHSMLAFTLAMYP